MPNSYTLSTVLVISIVLGVALLLAVLFFLVLCLRHRDLSRRYRKEVVEAARPAAAGQPSRSEIRLVQELRKQDSAEPPPPDPLFGSHLFRDAGRRRSREAARGSARGSARAQQLEKPFDEYAIARSERLFRRDDAPWPQPAAETKHRSEPWPAPSAFPERAYRSLVRNSQHAESQFGGSQFGSRHLGGSQFGGDAALIVASQESAEPSVEMSPPTRQVSTPASVEIRPAATPFNTPFSGVQDSQPLRLPVTEQTGAARVIQVPSQSPFSSAVYSPAGTTGAAGLPGRAYAPASPSTPMATARESPATPLKPESRDLSDRFFQSQLLGARSGGGDLAYGSPVESSPGGIIRLMPPMPSTLTMRSGEGTGLSAWSGHTNSRSVVLTASPSVRSRQAGLTTPERAAHAGQAPGRAPGYAAGHAAGHEASSTFYSSHMLSLNGGDLSELEVPREKMLETLNHNVLWRESSERVGVVERGGAVDAPYIGSVVSPRGGDVAAPVLEPLSRPNADAADAANGSGSSRGTGEASNESSTCPTPPDKIRSPKAEPGSAARTDGLFAAGLPTDGIFVDGLRTNGLRTNGFLKDELLTNERSINGPPMNGLPIDGLPIDRHLADAHLADSGTIDGRPRNGRSLNEHPAKGHPNGHPIDAFGAPLASNKSQQAAHPSDVWLQSPFWLSGKFSTLNLSRSSSLGADTVRPTDAGASERSEATVAAARQSTTQVKLKPPLSFSSPLNGTSLSLASFEHQIPLPQALQSWEKRQSLATTTPAAKTDRGNALSSLEGAGLGAPTPFVSSIRRIADLEPPSSPRSPGYEPGAARNAAEPRRPQEARSSRTATPHVAKTHGRASRAEPAQPQQEPSAAKHASMSLSRRSRITKPLPQAPALKTGVVAHLRGAKYVTVIRYNAQLGDELDLVPGNIVRVFEVFDDGWCLARIMAGSSSQQDKQGVCPKVCLVRCASKDTRQSQSIAVP